MKKTFVLFVAGAALLAGCSGMTKVAYNNADVMMGMMAKDYLDLDAAQSDELKTRIRRFHQWHRASELPLYEAFLRDAGGRFAKGLAAEDVAWGFAAVRGYYRGLAVAAVDEAAPLLAGLSQEQISVLEKRLAKNNAKYARDFLPAEEGRRVRAQTKRLLETIVQWTGDLKPDQEARVERFVRAHGRHTALRFEDRQRWQREAIALLRQRLPAKELAPRLARIFTEPEGRRSEEFRREERRWEEDFARLLVELGGSLSRVQHAQVARQLEAYANDFATLSGRAGRAGKAA